MKYTVDEKYDGQRIDMWLSEVTEMSRSKIQKLIQRNDITVNRQPVNPSAKLKTGDTAYVFVPPPTEDIELIPQEIELDIIHEDNDIIVVNKKAGMVVHPAHGHPDGTLVNALLAHCSDLSINNPDDRLRPGIVHRLDRDTSGVIIAAKNDDAFLALKQQFMDRTTHKEYLALVRGVLEPVSGRLETFYGRSPYNRRKMCVDPPSSVRKAITNYKLETQYDKYALVRFNIETGRTHQIRVHASYMGHPIMGDKLYGHRNTSIENTEVPRQMLHAALLKIKHPRTNEIMEFSAELPEDMHNLIDKLENKS